MTSKHLFVLSTLCAALAGCGGGGGGDSTPGGGGGGNPEPPASTSKFTQSGSWTFALPTSGTSLCYDFDAKAEVANCTGAKWDIKLTSGGRTASLWTNSGESGTGKGGAMGGPFDHTWAELQTYQDATVDPISKEALPSAVYLTDSASGVFTGTNGIKSAAFEYGVSGANDHSLYPNFRVFLITSDNTKADTKGAGVFALQVTGYYGGQGGTTSGYPSFRWIERTDGAVHKTATVNASQGWVYYDLVNAKEVTESGTWHVAFNRYTMKLNGGSSGTGAVGGFVGKTPAGFYDSDGNPIASKFSVSTNVSDTLPDLTATDITGPATATAWVKDSLGSALTPAYRGKYPSEPLNYGWFTYYYSADLAGNAGLPKVAHILGANKDNGTMIRNGEGTSYTRVRLSNIVYADPNSATSQQTWTFNYDLQPAAN